MAETIAIAANAAGIIGLADVACRLASTLYSFFAAVKNAPENVQNLVTELQLLQSVLADVQKYVTRLDSTPSGVQLDISNDCLHSVLRECQSKLEALRKTSMSVQDYNGDVRRFSRRLKWVLDEKKIKQHLAMVTRLKVDLLTAILVAGKQHDLAIKDQAEASKVELAQIKDDLKGYLTESKNLVTLDRNDIQELADRVCPQIKEAQSVFYDGFSSSINSLMSGQEEIVRSLTQCCSVVERGQLTIEDNFRRDATLMRVGNVTLSQQVLQNGKRSSRAARAINKSITQLRQQSRVDNKQIKKMIAKIGHRQQGSSLEISSIQFTRHSGTLEAVIIPLLLMKSSLHHAVSQYLEAPTAGMPRECLEFLVRQFEELLACSHVVSSQNIYRRLAESGGECDTKMQCNLGTAAFVNPLITSTYDTGHFRRLLNHHDSVGSLTIHADTHRTGKREEIAVSFAFVPEGFGNSLPNGVAASFQYYGLRSGAPSITRSLREIRYISARSPIHEAIAADDLSQVRELILQGQARPWDRNWGDRNLLAMAAFHTFTTPRDFSVLEYLLGGGWDFENADSIIWNIWANFTEFSCDYTSESPVLDIQKWIDVTRKCLWMDAPVDQHSRGGNLHLLCHTNYGNYETLTAVCRFLLEIGSDIEYVEDNGETPLLSSAYNYRYTTAVWLQVLLENGADCNSVDYDLRNALHLAFKKRKRYDEDFYEDPTDISVVLEKLTLLLQAGCSPWQVDGFGRTPGEYARESKVMALAWKTALEAAGQLDDEMLQLIADRPAISIFDIEDEEDSSIVDFDYREWDYVMEAFRLLPKPAFDYEEWDYVVEALRSSPKPEFESETSDWTDTEYAELGMGLNTVPDVKPEERSSGATDDLLVVNTVSLQNQPLDKNSAAYPPPFDGMAISTTELVLGDAPGSSSSVDGHQAPSGILPSPSAVSADDAIVLGLHHLWI